MNIAILSRRRLRISLLMIPCLAIGGGALHAQTAQAAAPDRGAEASRICRDTMGLNPANAPYGMCVNSLAENVPSADRSTFSAQAANFRSPEGTPLSAAEASCAQFGIKSGTEAFGTCVGNLSTTMNEANHPLPQ